MASAIETQRLISVSLGKIARSRAQRGGINLHKNLLVASVLNKARTAFMIENYSYQLSQQQKQQQVVATPQPAPITVSPSPVTETGNSLPTHVAETCQTTPDVESRSAPVDTQVASSELVNGGEPCSISYTNEMDAAGMESYCDKENVSPSSNDQSVISSSQSDQLVPESKQECVSGEQHIEAANQLSHDAQLAGSSQVCQNNTSSYITLTPCKQQSSAGTTTCAGILKRRRVNLEAVSLSSESDCPASKKARVVSSASSSSSSLESFSQTQNSQLPCDPVSGSSCEYESDSYESDMQTSDSPQITNLVSIFNSGFSGLCNVSSSPSPSSLQYDNTCYHQSDNSSSSVSHHSHHQSWSGADNQSLHCSSMVERIGSISSAIVLSA